MDREESMPEPVEITIITVVITNLVIMITRTITLYSDVDADNQGPLAGLNTLCCIK